MTFFRCASFGVLPVARARGCRQEPGTTPQEKISPRMSTRNAARLPFRDEEETDSSGVMVPGLRSITRLQYNQIIEAII